MSHNKVFNKEITKAKTYLTILISCTLYIMLSIFLGVFLARDIEYSFLPILADHIVLRGVITQFQMLISVYIVLNLNKEGYISAILLNIGSLASAIMYMLSMKSPDSIPGIISYMAVIIIVTLIMKYKTQATDFLNQIDNHKKQVERSEKRLYEQAYNDSLTKLPNRDFFMEELELEIREASISNKNLGVIYIDLDSFKTVNDTLGHSAGDEVLVETSKRFTEILDDNFMIAKSSGDEFFILARDVHDNSDIEKLMAKVMRIFCEPFVVMEIEFFISASAGIVVYPFDGDNGTELIKNADMSMYEAKRKGKNRYLFCNEDMKQKVQRKMLLTNSLYRALEKEEFFLHYQPQLAADTGAIIGFEALLRWNNSDHGLISPAEFIPLAEQTGLIKPIGLWVFRTVCDQCRNCNIEQKSSKRIAVNFSLEQLKDVNIVKHLIKIIEETETNPENIEIEVTESIAFNTDSVILEKLQELKKLGFLIAIDDFGKEYSALSRISSFPVDLIKIDMDFIHGISSDNPKDRAIVKTIIQMAKNLGIRVLAEGVETEEQYEFLKSEMCDEIQGFYFYKGMLASEAEKLIRSCSINNE